MRLVRTSRADPVAAAWDLWLVRVLSRFSVAVRPPLVSFAVAALALGIGLLAFAAVHAFGNQAADAVRLVPGYFGPGPGGLTDATHLVFACAVPLLLTVTVSLGHVLGLASVDPVGARQDREVWQGLGLSCRDVVVTHDAVPRVPLLAVVLTPVAALLTVEALTPEEHRLVALLLGVAVGVELLRLGVAAHRLSQGHEAEPAAGSIAPALAGVTAAALLGGAVGLAVRALRPLWNPRETDPVVADLARWLVSRPAPVVAAIVVMAVLGGVLLVRAVARGGGFRSSIGRAPRTGGRLAARLTEGLFPVTGPRRILQVWGTPELRWSVGAILLVAASGLDVTALPQHLVGILVVAALMGFCVTRLTASGPSAALTRLRHHVELGASPRRFTALLAGAAYVATLPVLIAVLGLLLLVAGSPPLAAAGIVALAPLATLVADAVVAQPGADGLTETRLLILAFLQSLLVMGGWFLFNVHPAAGLSLLLILTGVFAWLSPRRMTRWLPRSRP